MQALITKARNSTVFALLQYSLLFIVLKAKNHSVFFIMYLTLAQRRNLSQTTQVRRSLGYTF